MKTPIRLDGNALAGGNTPLEGHSGGAKFRIIPKEPACQDAVAGKASPEELRIFPLDGADRDRLLQITQPCNQG